MDDVDLSEMCIIMIRIMKRAAGKAVLWIKDSKSVPNALLYSDDYLAIKQVEIQYTLPLCSVQRLRYSYILVFLLIIPV